LCPTSSWSCSELLISLRSSTAEDTRAIGAAIADSLREGDVIQLVGELGSGKTTFAQGLAKGLGVDEPVVSPTFTLIREYAARLPIAHVDVYRLDRVQDVIDLGLDELADGNALVIVEWGDAVEELLGDERLRVLLAPEDPTGASDVRLISLSGVGRVWAERWERLEALLEPWGTAA
jgi:tRNA threonylcarbamoyladenosine biosynthesis protein TsaE